MTDRSLYVQDWHEVRYRSRNLLRTRLHFLTEMNVKGIVTPTVNRVLINQLNFLIGSVVWNLQQDELDLLNDR